MLINGEKWACETCIKGHRATHCQHTERQLVPIKKKGRPSTQCKRCRELRVIRQLHVKCDCEDQGDRLAKKKKESNSTSSTLVKKKKIDVLRPIAPKQEVIFTPSPPPPPLIPPTTTTTAKKSGGGCCGGNNKNISTVTQPNVSCCPSKSTIQSPSIQSPSIQSPLKIPIDNVPLPKIPPPSSCCGPPSKNQQGEMIRVVTCRCGDSCACIGCDAHPSRAMKEGRDDVYIGFDDNNKNRRLSIAAITTKSNTLPKLIVQAGTDYTQQQQYQHPSSILNEDGVLICGCGCGKGFEDCSDCFRELCHYL